MKFSCEKCGKTFDWKSNYTRHLDTHDINRKEKFKCVVCDVHYFNKQNLNFHLKTVHKIKNGNKNLQTYDCIFCKKKVRSMWELEIHLRYHSLEKPYFCKVCPAELIAKSDLTRHLQRLHQAKPSRPFRCEFCTKSFITSNELTRHLRMHLREKPFKCNICFKNFADEGNLRKHLRIHTGEKPFSCEVCGKVFNQTSTLKTHIQVHNKDRPFKCQGCVKTFRHRHGLKYHEKTAHV